MKIKRIFASVLFAITFAVGIVGSGMLAAQATSQTNIEYATMATGPVLGAENDPGFIEGWDYRAMLKGIDGTPIIEGHGGKWIPIVAPALKPRTASMLFNSRMPLSGSDVKDNDFGLSAMIVTAPD